MLQAGLNGVDNGQLWFDHVRVPRDALLDRYASVAEDGTYSSPIPSVAQRFGTMVGGLTTGAPLPGHPECTCVPCAFTFAFRCAPYCPVNQGQKSTGVVVGMRPFWPH